MSRRRVAVIGSGIAGLSAAWTLATEAKDRAAVTLFEAGDYFGGHTHTVDLTLDGITQGVDTGFLVFNQRTYPRLIKLFDTLQVATVPSDMSFSVQVPQSGLEWSGSDLNSVFAQRANLLRPRFWGMLADLLPAGSDAPLPDPAALSPESLTTFTLTLIGPLVWTRSPRLKRTCRVRPFEPGSTTVSSKGSRLSMGAKPSFAVRT